MYRNSDNSDSTASSRTHVTGQTGRKPGEGINFKQNNTHDARFDSLEIPVCVRKKRQGTQNSKSSAHYNTAQFSSTQRTRHTESFSSVNQRTGSVPYLYLSDEARRKAKLSRTRTSTNAIPRVASNNRLKNKKNHHPLVSFILANQKAVMTCVILFLCISVIVPLAVYAAVSEEGSTAPDFDMLGTVPENLDVLDAEEIYLGASGGTQATEKPVSTDTPSEPAEPDNTTTDDAAPEDTEETEKEETPEESEEAETTEEVTEEATEDQPVAPAGFKVTVQFYDRELLTCTTGPTTLRQILDAAGIWLTELEHPSIGLDDPIEYESWITVEKTEYKQVTESEAIPYSSETVNSTSVPRGTYQTVTYGKNGVRDTVYTVEYRNGVEVSRTKEYDYIAAYPVNEVVHYGIGGTFTAPDGNTYSYSYCTTVRATYYNIHGTTATGMPTGHNVIATDPYVFPLGTRMYVLNDTFDMGVRIAADTGGAVKGNLIDIWMDETSPYYEQFAARGVWDMTVYVLD